MSKTHPLIKWREILGQCAKRWRESAGDKNFGPSDAIAELHDAAEQIDDARASAQANQYAGRKVNAAGD